MSVLDSFRQACNDMFAKMENDIRELTAMPAGSEKTIIEVTETLPNGTIRKTTTIKFTSKKVWP